MRNYIKELITCRSPEEMGKILKDWILSKIYGERIKMKLRKKYKE